MEYKENLTLQRLPDAMSYLIGEIADIKTMLRNRSESLPEQKEDLRLHGDKALAEHLHCSIQTVSTLKKARKVTFHRMGRRCYYLVSEVDEDLQVLSRKFGKK